jgi:predicted RNA-binding protein with PIN domain
VSDPATRAEPGPPPSSQPDETDRPPEDVEESVQLTRPLRARVLSIAADALGKMPADQLPASLRRVAAFTPARRARLAANPLASALETDAGFREQLATQVRLTHADLASALDAGSAPMAADPVELAALAYLLRPPGWTAMIRTHAAAESTEPAVSPAQSQSTNERLHGQLARARAEVRAAKAQERERIRALQSERDVLRKRVAELGQQLSAARDAAANAEQLLAGERARLEAAAPDTDARERRFRARIRELEAELATARRGARESRTAGTMRARLLLDTLLETAQGLRRELALPPVTTSFADTVDAVVPPPVGSSGAAGAALGSADPALLSELLNLPRMHLVVDGYNVTKTAWPATVLQSQRERLVAGLGALAARTGAEVTVVFDGADLKHPPPTGSPRGVRVLFSPPGVIADDVIRALVEAEPSGRPLVVVSSDREVADGVESAGARAVAAAALVGLLDRS